MALAVQPSTVNGCNNFVVKGDRAVRTTSLKIAGLILFVAVTLAMAPMASANSVTFNLSSNNNLGISGSIGTVTIVDSGLNQVTVSVMMNAGFSVKLNGGDFAFNGPSGLRPSDVSGFTISNRSGSTTYSGLDFQHMKTTQNVSVVGNFAFDFTDIKGQPKGVVSADTVTFVLTAAGLSASQFNGVGLHFCTASGFNCSPKTGFVGGTEETTMVPEPGSLGLMGTGLVGLGGLIRRRFLSKTI